MTYKFDDSLEFNDSIPALGQMPAIDDFKTGTVAWLLQRYYDQWRKRIGPSQFYTLRRLQRSPIGKKAAAALKPSDIIAHCQMRIAQPIRPGSDRTVQPATIGQDVTYLRVVLDYAKGGWDMENVTADSIKDAMPKLIKFGLVAKSRPRDRRPTSLEWGMLITDFRIPPRRGKAPIIPMDEIMEFQVWSARRISETCGMLFADVDQEKRTVLIRDMKDPRQKKGNNKTVPLLGRAWDIVEKRLKNWDGKDQKARVFPYNAKSVGASFTERKKKLGIENLRLHDLRREAASRLFEQGYAVQEVMMVTGHKTPMMLLRVYTKLKPEDLHKGPAAKRMEKPDSQNVVLAGGAPIIEATRQLGEAMTQ